MRLFKWFVPMVAIAFAATLSVHAAEQAANTGTVKGTVYMTDGTTPAASAMVRLRPAVQRGDAAGDGEHAMTTTTDANGQFTMNAPAGDYKIVAALRKVGETRQEVKITAGETQTVNLTLVAREPKKDEPKKERPQKEPRREGERKKKNND